MLQRLLQRFWIVLPLLLVFVVGMLVQRHLSAPVHGRVTSSGKQSVVTAQKASMAKEPPASASNEYFTLTLPAGFTSQSSTIPPGLLYAQTFLKPSIEGTLIVSVGISDLPREDLSANTSYTSRVQQPERYQSSTIVIGDAVIHTMNDTKSDAIAAFWVHGPRLATISVTTGLDNPNKVNDVTQIKTLRQILDAWQWL